MIPLYIVTSDWWLINDNGTFSWCCIRKLSTFIFVTCKVPFTLSAVRSEAVWTLAGDEEFRGRRSSYLEQFTSRPVNRNSLPIDVRSTSEGAPVRLIDSASEDHLWRSLIIVIAYMCMVWTRHCCLRARLQCTRA